MIKEPPIPIFLGKKKSKNQNRRIKIFNGFKNIKETIILMIKFVKN
jgi:hypothetical protein